MRLLLFAILLHSSFLFLTFANELGQAAEEGSISNEIQPDVDIVKRSADPHRHFGHHHHHHHGGWGHYHGGWGHHHHGGWGHHHHHGHGFPHFHVVFKRNSVNEDHANEIEDGVAPEVSIDKAQGHDVSKRSPEPLYTGALGFDHPYFVQHGDHVDVHVPHEFESPNGIAYGHEIKKRNADPHHAGSLSYSHPHLVPHGDHLDIHLGHHHHGYHGARPPYYNHGIGKRSAEPHHTGLLSYAHPHLVPHGDHLDIHLGHHQHYNQGYYGARPPYFNHGIGKRSAEPHHTGSLSYAHPHLVPHGDHLDIHLGHHQHYNQGYYGARPPYFNHGIGKRSAEPQLFGGLLHPHIHPHGDHFDIHLGHHHHNRPVPYYNNYYNSYY